MSNIEQLENELEIRKSELSFEEQLELREKILEAKKKAGFKPNHHQITCVGCGS